jgi:protein-arginine kinase
MDPFKVNDVRLDTVRILQVYCSISRCFAGIRFPPCADASERSEVERIVVNALGCQNGVIEGEYFPQQGSNSMLGYAGGAEDMSAVFAAMRSDNANRQNGGNYYWVQSGCARHFPNGFGVFASEDRSFFATVNGFEHVCLKATSSKPNFKETFTRVVQAEDQLRNAVKQDGVDFAFSNRLGYLASNPATVGTGLRAGAILTIPLLSAHKDFQQIIDRMGLGAVQSTMGAGAWEVFNRFGFGMTGSTQVNAVQKAVHMLLRMETALNAGSPVDGSSLPPMLATSELGLFNTNAGATKPCREIRTDWMQLVSGVEECGAVDPSSKFVTSVTMRLGRNLSGLTFSPGSSMEARREVERCVVNALLNLNGKFEGEYYPLKGSMSFMGKPGGMCDVEEASVAAAGLLFDKPMAPSLVAAGAAADWPDARGVFIGGSGLSARLNEFEHVMLQATCKGADVREAFGMVCNAESVLRLGLKQDGNDFAYSESEGYVSASPSATGTVLTASATVAFPLLMARADFTDVCCKLHLQMQPSVGGSLELCSVPRPGVSEVEQVSAFMEGLRKLVELEQGII